MWNDLREQRHKSRQRREEELKWHKKKTVGGEAIDFNLIKLQLQLIRVSVCVCVHCVSCEHMRAYCYSP